MSNKYFIIRDEQAFKRMVDVYVNELILLTINSHCCCMKANLAPGRGFSFPEGWLLWLINQDFSRDPLRSGKRPGRGAG